MKINQQQLEQKQQNLVNKNPQSLLIKILDQHVVILKIQMIIMMIHGIIELVKKVIYILVIQMIKKYLLEIFLHKLQKNK
jgi:hypothetical protein